MPVFRKKVRYIKHQQTFVDKPRSHHFLLVLFWAIWLNDTVRRLTAINAAAYKGGNASSILRKLLAQGVDVNSLDEDGWAPLHFASINGQGKPAL